MSMFTMSLFALTSANYFVPLPAAQPAAVGYYQAEAAAPAALPFLARADVVMNTQYQEEVFTAVGRKKNRKSGKTKSLYGYTTGSRAPKGSTRSGTVNEYGYGFDNLYGGQKRKRDLETSVANTKAQEKRTNFLILLAVCSVFLLFASSKP
jgi:hypothetical protein